MFMKTIVEHHAPNGYTFRVCTHCQLAIDENGKPDPKVYSQKFIEAFETIPSEWKCAHLANVCRHCGVTNP